MLIHCHAPPTTARKGAGLEIIAALAVTLAIGVLIGVNAMSKRPIINNITQNVNHSVSVAGGGAARSVAGVVFPVLALGALGVITLAAVSSSTNANQQVTDTAARSIEAQREIVQAMPQPQIIIQPAQPPQVTVNTPTLDLMPLVNVIAVAGVGVLAVFVAADITRRTITQRRQDRQRRLDRERALYTKSQRLTHPAFDIANQNVRQEK